MSKKRGSHHKVGPRDTHVHKALPYTTRNGGLRSPFALVRAQLPAVQQHLSTAASFVASHAGNQHTNGQALTVDLVR